MEPIGTITNFYPFLSQETREIVETTLGQAEGYDQFVSKLVDIFLEQDEINDFSYFATIQAWMSVNNDIVNKMRPRLMENIVLRPFMYFQFDWTEEEFDMDFPTALRHALEKSESWVQFHLLQVSALLALPPTDRPRYLEKARELLEAHPELDCFSTEILIRIGGFLRYEGDINGAMEKFQEAKTVADRYNDIIRKFDAQCDFASCLKETDVFQALDLMEESYQTFKSLGAKAWTGSVASNMGLLHAIIGEYDLAVEFYRESTRIRKPSGRTKGLNAYALSRLYCDADFPEKALDWIKDEIGLEDFTPSTLETIPSYDFPIFSLAVVRALIQLDRLDGISQLLEETNKQLLQRGADALIMTYNYVMGLYEVAIDNLDAGIQNMADALAEAERMNFQVTINSILLSLTKTELKNYKALGTGGTESSGQWMTRLGIHAREKNYPGIMMQHALLKADYQEMNGEMEAARLTLQDALTFTDSLGVKTLRKRIQERLQELETSVDA
ncbi:MAG: tetratricopeptide repeat protein [Candidatus Thorarchaeota archaeon]